jgi:hypothetical protein
LLSFEVIFWLGIVWRTSIIINGTWRTTKAYLFIQSELILLLFWYKVKLIIDLLKLCYKLIVWARTKRHCLLNRSLISSLSSWFKCVEKIIIIKIDFQFLCIKGFYFLLFSQGEAASKTKICRALRLKTTTTTWTLDRFGLLAYFLYFFFLEIQSVVLRRFKFKYVITSKLFL